MSSTNINTSNTSSSPNGHENHQHEFQFSSSVTAGMDSAVMNNPHPQAPAEAPSSPYPPAAVAAVVAATGGEENDSEGDDDNDSLEDGEIREAEDVDNSDSLEEGEIREDEDDNSSLEEGESKFLTRLVVATETKKLLDNFITAEEDMRSDRGLAGTLEQDDVPRLGRNETSTSNEGTQRFTPHELRLVLAVILYA
ncbi:hypothetical protein QBC45DRAFT_436334 [Copromyces sp. CBS 386.78]|nr:hypothetical protein QBC45DRAFT_436334 [Copromyces sp. CBS 386.78]